MEMPQSSVEGLGWIFCKGRGKHPILLQNKQNSGCDWSSSHQGQRALWGPDPGGSRWKQKGCSCWRVGWVGGGCIPSLSQVFLKHTVMRMSKSNYSPIKDKDVTWEGAATQRLAMQRRARAKCAHHILRSGCSGTSHDKCNVINICAGNCSIW